MNKIKLSNEPKTEEQGEFKKLIFDYDITPGNLINYILYDKGFICSSSKESKNGKNKRYIIF